MKKLLSCLLFCSVITATAATITDDLINEMANKKATDQIRINVVLKAQYDAQKLMHIASGTHRATSREIVKAELKAFSNQTQNALLNQLATLERVNSISKVQPLWITNMINCTATPQAIAILAERADVASIDFDETRNLLIGEDKLPAQAAVLQKSGGKAITDNVTQVRANQVWSQGYTGQGVLVSIIDSGVNYQHVDLQDHLWNGGSQYPHHGYDFVNNDNDPLDDNGHGTHCAGTIAGDGSGSSATGAAPDATVMILKVMNSNGSGTESQILQGIQFSLEHQADVISMSLGWLASNNPNRKNWRNAMNNILASGILAVVAAGNSGDDAYTGNSGEEIPWNICTPGDCPPPWQSPDQVASGGLSSVLSVGATQQDDAIAYFSSRGPVPWNARVVDYNDYAYTVNSATETGLIRPDIVAPGKEITSCDYSSNTGYTVKSGTSMATPLTAGVIALMLSKKNDLTPAEICRIIQQTAANKPIQKSNTYGAGRLDALTAVNGVSVLPLAVDVELVAIKSPVSGNALTNSEAVKIAIKNNGSVAISHGLTLAFQVDNQTAVTQSYNGVTIDAGSEVEFIFSLKADLSSAGMHTVKVTALLPNDGYSYNDSKSGLVGNLAPFTVPFYENFEKELFPPFGWTSNNPDNATTWTLKPVAGNAPGSQSAYLNFYNYDTSGAKDELISPVISLSNISNPVLTFKLAYRQALTTADGLKIYLSTDAGSSFGTTPVYNKSGAALATTTASTYPFEPSSSSQWRLETINLSSFSGKNIALKFESFNQNGNNLYIDDIKVNGSLGIESAPTVNATELRQNYPNPFNPTTTISFYNNLIGDVKLTILNVKGEIVATLLNCKLTAGTHSVVFDAAGLNSGVYFYKLATPATTITKKMLMLK